MTKIQSRVLCLIEIKEVMRHKKSKEKQQQPQKHKETNHEWKLKREDDH